MQSHLLPRRRTWNESRPICIISRYLFAMGELKLRMGSYSNFILNNWDAQQTSLPSLLEIVHRWGSAFPAFSRIFLNVLRRLTSAAPFTSSAREFSILEFSCSMAGLYLGMTSMLTLFCFQLSLEGINDTERNP